MWHCIIHSTVSARSKWNTLKVKLLALERFPRVEPKTKDSSLSKQVRVIDIPLCDLIKISCPQNELILAEVHRLLNHWLEVDNRQEVSWWDAIMNCCFSHHLHARSKSDCSCRYLRCNCRSAKFNSPQRASCRWTSRCFTQWEDFLIQLAFLSKCVRNCVYCVIFYLVCVKLLNEYFLQKKNLI
jgi:hypothetical protein